MATGTLILRADVGAGAGAGHLTRCLSLALAAREAGHDAVFVLEADSAASKEEVRRAGFASQSAHGASGSPEDAAAVATLAAERGGDWVVVDGYVFGADYVGELKAADCRVLAFDDHGMRGPSPADVVLDGNLDADPADYSGHAPGSTLLLGSEYVCLRPGFAEMRERVLASAVPERAAHLVITFGGGDPVGLSVLALEALRDGRLADLRSTLVLGPSASPLEHAVPEGVEVVRGARDMAVLLGRADLALAAAGSTSWELCCLGVPAALVAAAPNQEPIGERLAARGAAVYLGRADDATAALFADTLAGVVADAGARASLRRSASSLVDGAGAHRVVLAMSECAARDPRRPA